MASMVDMVDDATMMDLTKMGFSADQVKVAMVRCGNDVNAAVDMLTSGQVPEQDAFDLLATSEKPYGDGSKKAPFNPQPADPNKGGFAEGGAVDASAVDGRLSRFKEMGFSVPDAERALAACGNDVDAALTMLLGGAGAYSDSPHAVLEEASDPYGAAKAAAAGAAKPFAPRPVDKNKGNFVEAPGMAPSAILDGRLARFQDMGFSVEDAERALASTGNDVDAALTKLLSGTSLNAGEACSPHDVLAETPDPYSGPNNPKKRPDPVPNDVNKGNWVRTAPTGAPPAAVVDSRLAHFLEMGFTVEETEKALAFCKNDVDAALSMLLQAKQDAMTVTA